MNHFIKALIIFFIPLFCTSQAIALTTEESLQSPKEPTALKSLNKSNELTDTETGAKIQEGYGKLPLYFIQNDGQVDEKVKFYEKGSGHSTFFTKEGVYLSIVRNKPVIARDEVPKAVLALSGAKKSQLSEKIAPPIPSPLAGKGRAGGELTPQLIKLIPLNANKNPEIIAVDSQEGKVNYFIGNDPKKWRINIPTYKAVLYKEAYPGIDVKFYGNNRQMEYDIIVKPGADPSKVEFTYEGIKGLSITEEGDLEIVLSSPFAGEGRGEGNKIIQKKPHIYQEIDGQRVKVDGAFKIITEEVPPFKKGGARGDFEIAYSFDVSSYDKKHPLIIDPTLVYSTYLGGSSDDYGNSIIAVDSSGNAYVTGYTVSADFPTASPLQASLKGTSDAFVVKINPSGSALVYSTYLGGSSDDYGNGITVDPSGNAYVTGWTGSTDFPTTVGSLQPSYGGGLWDAFVAKINSSGNVLLYSTYLGGSSDDYGNGIIAVDSSGNAYITGGTYSGDFPTASPLQASIQGLGSGSSDAFVAKINPSGSALVYSTYLGGSNYDWGFGIAIDSSGNAYVTGYTVSADFPTASPLQASYGGGINDAFVAKINPSGNVLLYSTYLGGSNGELGVGIAVDPSGNAYVTGWTGSTDFPTTVGSLQPSYGGGLWDAFVTKINPSGSALVYSTYLGGTNGDYGYGIAVDSSGNAYVTGYTASADFPTASPLQASYGGGRDAFVVKINPSGGALVYSTYLGGGSDDYGNGITVDSSGNAYVTGWAGSTDFPTTVGSLQPSYGGGLWDAFVAKISSWPVRYNDPANQNDVAAKVVTDASGNVYVTGWSHNGVTFDYATMKYDPAGTQLWVARYDGGRGDFAPDMVLDSSGNVYVTGWSNNGTNNDIVTIKYDTNGNQLWLARYDNGGNDAGFRVLVDGAGNVYVGGNSSNGSNDDYVVVKYDSSGNQLWVSRYNNGSSEGLNSMALDSSGNVYATGWSNDGGGIRDYATVKYDTNGNQLWAARYNSPANQNDVGLKVMADGSGNAYVTGWSFNGTNFDYTTVKYDPAGTQLWVARYDSGRGDFAPDMVVDGSGNVYVTGWSNSGTNYDAVTIKYDTNGNQLWLARYDNGGNDAGFRVLVDGAGNVVVGGNSSNGSNDDYIVVKYDSLGNQLWTARYDNGNSEGINSLALDSPGNVYATGWSNNASGIRDYATVKYGP